jgi:pimeloyl-ACP methyl ester carboxylesterase
VEWTERERSYDWTHLEGTFRAPRQSTGDLHDTTVELFLHAPTAGPRPLVLVMPILGGSYPIARHLARFVAETGWHAAFVHRLRGDHAISGEEDAETLDLDTRDGVVSCRRALDALLALPQVDPRRVGLAGISLGAMAGSVLMAVEPRITGGVLMMGGGDIPGIVSLSEERPVRLLREKLMRERGLDDAAELVRQLRSEILLDPLRFAPYVGPERVLQMVATHDDRVHTPYQWRLWEGLGRPSVSAMPIGHYTAAVYIGYAKGEMVRFLRKRFHEALTGAPTQADLRPPAAPGALPPPEDTDRPSITSR